ncbi:hypothetical protein NL676_026075 [Syzygium grande]|nr:hypothetical protein NL676_026075 [Syzygium grande]
MLDMDEPLLIIIPSIKRRSSAPSLSCFLLSTVSLSISMVTIIAWWVLRLTVEKAAMVEQITSDEARWGETDSDEMPKEIDNVNGHDGQLSLVEEEEEEGSSGKVDFN